LFDDDDEDAEDEEGIGVALGFDPEAIALIAFARSGFICPIDAKLGATAIVAGDVGTVGTGGPQRFFFSLFPVPEAPATSPIDAPLLLLVASIVVAAATAADISFIFAVVPTTESVEGCGVDGGGGRKFDCIRVATEEEVVIAAGPYMLNAFWGKADKGSIPEQISDTSFWARLRCNSSKYN